MIVNHLDLGILARLWPKCGLLCCALLWLASSAQAQTTPWQGLRCRWVRPLWQADSTGALHYTFAPDTLTLAPDSIRVAAWRPRHVPVQGIAFRYKPSANLLTISLPARSSPPPDSLYLCYRVFPYLFGQRAAHRQQAKYDSGLYQPQAIDYGLFKAEKPQREQLFGYEGLQKNGSLTRGISFGNRQDVVVTSALNLQLEGKISDDLHLTAVLTDQNVPFQPEGNTQQIQQFDRVYIRLDHALASLSAGDVVLQTPTGRATTPQGGTSASLPTAEGQLPPPSHFLRYYKNVLGASVETPWRSTADSTARQQAHSQVAIGVAKGRFHSQLIDVQEGVLGPYRLRGPENERFIVILANAERVFLDGRPLVRGFNYDYVIDYNTAEITFTPRVLITRFSRVRVDFEFTSQNYSRSLLAANHHHQWGRLRLFSQFYREADNPRNPLLANLSNSDKLLLSQVGDSVQLALAPAVQPVAEWDANRILYAARDTLWQGRNLRIYVRALAPQAGLLSVVFAEVGPNLGDYELANATANGRAYQWVGPGRGRYAALRPLPAPNKRQMWASGASYQINASEKIFAEVAISQLDPNLFSAQGNADNQGWATRLGYANTGQKLTGKLWNGATLTSGVDFEHTSANFRPVDRFRHIEFDRDWSIDNPGGFAPATFAADNIFNLYGGLRKQARYVQAKHSRRLRENDESKGFQQWIDAGWNVGNFFTQINFFGMKNRFSRQQNELASQWQRFSLHLWHGGKRLVPGYLYTTDRNAVRHTRNDSIVGTAMNFAEHKAYLKSGDSSRLQMQLDYSFREDFAPLLGRMEKANRAHTVNLAAQRKTEKHFVNFLFTYRQLATLRSAATDENLTGRLDWNAQFWRGGLRSELTLTSGSGRELRREFVFLQVNSGQGTHTWRDDNADGLQQINEFYLAINPDERNFIKFFTPTDQYLNAYTNGLSYRLNAAPPRQWATASGLKQWASRLSNISAWTINRRHTAAALLPRLLPFAPTDTAALLGSQDVFRSTFFYNRTVPKFGVELSWASNAQRNLLTNGYEARQTREAQGAMRYKVGQHFNLRLALLREQRTNQSDFMANRNYRVQNLQLRPEIAWQPSPALRIAGQYVLQQKHNTLPAENGEQARFHEFIAELRTAQEGKRTVNARLRYVRIAYTGTPNSPVGYEMLEALQPGQNLNWTLQWQQRLANGLQLQIQYEGRQSAGQPLIHLGRMQVTALF